ncbi:MAG: hypothetical protein KAG84_04535 [Bacteroidales bacterium]|nr:hypothetical protein [Bacteroidales bacterium]
MRIFRTILLLTILFSFISTKTYADKRDSVIAIANDTSSILFFYKDSPFSKSKLHYVDSTLHNSQRYAIRMNAYDMAANTHFIGGPLKDLYFHELSPQFTIGEYSLGKTYYRTDEMPYYKNVRTPYSEVFYTMASSEENHLKGILAAQPSERLYYGMNFNVESTIGLMTNSKVQNAHFRGVIGFETISKRYGYDVEYIYNKIKFGENGGLINETDHDSTELEQQILAVNLNEAYNYTKSNYFAFDQFLNIGKASTDSTSHKFLGRLYLNTTYESKARVYSDKNWDTLYYKNAFLDTIQSFDSLAITDFKVDFGISNFYPEKHQYFIFNLGLAYNYKMYYNGNKDFFFNYASPHGDVIFDFYKFILEGGARYQIKIPNSQTIDIGANDLNLYGRMKFPLFKNFNLDAGIKMDFVSPEIKAYSTYSNHFMWDNKFDKQKHIEINSHLDIKGYKLEGAVHTLSDFVYYDNNITPQQHKESFQIITAKFKKKFQIKSVGTHLMLMYQQSSNNDVVRLPQFVAKGNFFFSLPIFKGALILHPGVDITYLTAYKGYGYNPAGMQFYSYHGNDLKDQIYVDLYLNIRIKRARVFFKYQNATSKFGSYKYFLIKGYPQQVATLKFGLSWRFID